jgi:hypothetical protein
MTALTDRPLPGCAIRLDPTIGSRSPTWYQNHTYVQQRIATFMDAHRRRQEPTPYTVSVMAMV